MIVANSQTKSTNSSGGSRAAQRIGYFGQGLVMYTLIRKGYGVALVDDVGADVIAERQGERYAISVKTRVFRPGSRESRSYVIEQGHVDKVKLFAQRYAMTALLAHVVCLADEKRVHLFVLPIADIQSVARPCKWGYHIRYGPKHLQTLCLHPKVDYSGWTETVSCEALFFKSPQERTRTVPS